MGGEKCGGLLATLRSMTAIALVTVAGSALGTLAQCVPGNVCWLSSGLVFHCLGCGVSWARWTPGVLSTAVCSH